MAHAARLAGARARSHARVFLTALAQTARRGCGARPIAADAKEIFGLYDKQANGTIQSKDLGEVLRAVGQNPTKKELDEIKAKVDPQGNKPLAFADYLKIQNRAEGWKAHGTEEEFVQGFAVFDRDGNGLISAGELRYVLTSLGEKLTDRDVDELLRGIETDKDGFINYAEFVKTILAG